jgi:hypothetical protein
MTTLDKNGHEVLSSDPMAVVLRPARRSMFDHMRDLIKTEISRQAQNNDQESFEDADDFDVGDDYDPRSPWEMTFDQQAATEPEAAPPPAVPAEPAAAPSGDS